MTSHHPAFDEAETCGPQTTHAALGQELHELVAELYPLCRSITGPGLRETLRLIQQRIPLELVEVPTGTPVFDWQIPKEWRIRDAFVKDPQGRRVIDFRRCNLHVVNYSVPVHRRLSLSELSAHLHSLPDKPDLVPYRTSYYRPDWGFCLAHRERIQLPDQVYEVCIDAEHVDGALTYGECYLPGKSEDEVLFSSHVCHPSLANDNLAGVSVAVHLARYLSSRSRRYSYRFLFAPGTIGAIAWLARNEARLATIRHGLVLATLGDAGSSNYKRSRRGNAEIDQAVSHVLRHSGQPYAIHDFEPLGYDERQYGSPGINLPVGCLMRTPPGRFAAYHTSADNLEFVRPESLYDSWSKCVAIVDVLEHNHIYRNLSPKCEPQLGRRGLYQSLGGQTQREVEQALLWVLNLSDGSRSLLDIADQARLNFAVVKRAADALWQCDLLSSPTRKPGAIHDA